MFKSLLVVTGLFVCGLSLAAVDCGSSNYTYNTNVKQACDKMQQLNSQAKKNFQNTYSQNLVATQNKLSKNSSSTAASTTTNSGSDNSNNTSTTTTTTTTNTVDTNTDTNSPASNSSTTPNQNNSTPQQPSSNSGVSYY